MFNKYITMSVTTVLTAILILTFIGYNTGMFSRMDSESEKYTVALSVAESEQFSDYNNTVIDGQKVLQAVSKFSGKSEFALYFQTNKSYFAYGFTSQECVPLKASRSELDLGGMPIRSVSKDSLWKTDSPNFINYSSSFKSVLVVSGSKVKGIYFKIL